MTPEQKKIGWTLGLAAGAATIVGTILLWPKKAKAATPPQKGYVQYVSSWSSPTFPAKVGDQLTIDLPSLEGTAYEWHVEGGENLAKALPLSGNYQNPGPLQLVFVQPGSATIWVKKQYARDEKGPKGALVEPPMAVNVSVSA